MPKKYWKSKLVYQHCSESSLDLLRFVNSRLFAATNTRTCCILISSTWQVKLPSSVVLTLAKYRVLKVSTRILGSSCGFSEGTLCPGESFLAPFLHWTVFSRVDLQVDLMQTNSCLPNTYLI